MESKIRHNRFYAPAVYHQGGHRLVVGVSIREELGDYAISAGRCATGFMVSAQYARNVNG